LKKVQIGRTVRVNNTPKRYSIKLCKEFILIPLSRTLSKQHGDYGYEREIKRQKAIKGASILIFEVTSFLCRSLALELNLRNLLLFLFRQGRNNHH